MIDFPKSPHLFLSWWLIDVPKRIFLVFKRLIFVTNNFVSFTLNIRLLFTPLFGDYSLIGRFIGFVFRLFEIAFGSTFVIILAALSPILIIFWWILPILVFIKIRLISFVIGGIIFFLWEYLERNEPETKAINCDETTFLKSVRPNTQTIYHAFINSQKSGLKLLIETNEIKKLLEILELNVNGFPERFVSSPLIDLSKLPSQWLGTAKQLNCRFLETEVLFLTVLKLIPKSDLLLSTFSTKLSIVEGGVRWYMAQKEQSARKYLWQEDFDKLYLGGTGKGMTGHITPALDYISEDFTKKASFGGFERFAERKDDIKKLASLLNTSTENILVLGPPGAGKTSIIKGLAYNVIRGTEFKGLKNKRIVSVSLMSYMNDPALTARLKKAIQEAKSSGDVILFIDEIHTLVSENAAKNPEVSIFFNLLEPELSSGNIQFIGATTLQNYRKYIEPNGAFSRLFHIMEISEASESETLEILKFEAISQSKQKNIVITFPAIYKTIELSKKLIHERVLPDKAVQILDRAASVAENRTKVLDSSVVLQVIAEITHIPSELLSQDEANKLLNIEGEMKKMVIGQDHALKQITSALKRARTGIRNENKPIASFLFVGTTGVGKTQTAKALAKTYFGSAKTMIRLDMSEYQQIDSISRLIGSPDGNSKGFLTEAVRNSPFSLILLDEIEKAHPNILLTFLQLLDEGRLTDSRGITYNFTNSIIISTSNVGTRSIQEIFSKNGNIQDMQNSALKDVRAQFAPEFLNRFTGIIVFNPLTPQNIKDITNLLLDDVRKNAESRQIKVSFKPALVEALANLGYSQQWGARPLARTIEDTVELFLADKILSKEFKQGDEVTLGTEVIPWDHVKTEL